MRLRLPEFEMATRRAGHDWKLHDLTDSFGYWLARQPYIENYWSHPDRLVRLYNDSLQMTPTSGPWSGSPGWLHSSASFGFRH